MRHLLTRILVIVLCTSFITYLPLNSQKAEANVSTTVASVYVDAPFVQGSYARHHGGVTENFNSLTSSAGGTSVTSNSHSIVGGTKTSGQFSVFDNNNTFGATTTSETATVGGSGSKFANTDSTGFEISFSTPVKYIGFYWAAGNAGNSVEFYSGSTTVASFSTRNLFDLLGSPPDSDDAYRDATDSITATNGSRYLKKYYFGPAAGYSSETPTARSSIPINNEPYAYVHAFALNDESFDRVKIFGSGFEFDNLTVSTQEVPIRNALVLVNEVTTSLTLGTSTWSFRGVTSNDSTTVSTNWLSDSSTATSGSRISIRQTLSIDTGTITMGRTALFRATLTDASGVSCGTYSLIDSFTATNNTWMDVQIVDSGTDSRSQLVRGNCYAWATNPASRYGTGAIRPTSSAANTRFNSNLDSARLILPRLPDVKIPRAIPADPTKLQLSFPRTKVTQGPGQMQVCLFETSESSLTGWGNSSGTQNLRFVSGSSEGSTLSAQSSNSIQSLFDDLKIQRINSSRFSVNRYLLIRIAPRLGTGFTTDCSGSGSGNSVTFTGNLWPRQSDTFLVHLKPINLTQTRTLYVPLKNGRQP